MFCVPPDLPWPGFHPTNSVFARLGKRAWIWAAGQLGFVLLKLEHALGLWWPSLPNYALFRRHANFRRTLESLTIVSRELRFFIEAIEFSAEREGGIKNLLDNRVISRQAQLRTYLFYTRRGPGAIKACLREYMKQHRKGQTNQAKRSFEIVRSESVAYAEFLSYIIEAFASSPIELNPGMRFHTNKMLIAIKRAAEKISQAGYPVTRRELNGMIQTIDLLHGVLSQYAGLVRLLEYGE